MFDLEHLVKVFSRFDLERNHFMVLYYSLDLTQRETILWSRLNFTVSNTCISCHCHVILKILNGAASYILLDAVKFNLEHEMVALFHLEKILF